MTPIKALAYVRDKHRANCIARQLRRYPDFHNSIVEYYTRLGWIDHTDDEGGIHLANKWWTSPTDTARALQVTTLHDWIRQ